MTTEETKKNCGTCRHWEAWPSEYYGISGDCLYPLPESVQDTGARVMLATYGTTCRTWEPKEKKV